MRQGGVNTRQGILSISHHEPPCLGSLFLRLYPRIIKMLSRIKKYNAVYGRTINIASKLITFPLQRIIYFAALGPLRSHSPLLLSYWLMSELCKIESPISLHLMSLNFVKKKGGERETEDEREKAKEGGGREWEHCFVLGMLIQYTRVGVKCLRAHAECLLGHNCGCPNSVWKAGCDVCCRLCCK